MSDQFQGWNPKDRVGMTKAPLRLVPPAGLIEVSKVMSRGAEKYGPYNWREQKVRYMVYVEAALRHLYAAMDGEDRDADSDAPHLASVAACMLILLDAIACGSYVDDRPAIRGKTGQLIKETTVQPLTPRAPRTVRQIINEQEAQKLPADFPYSSLPTWAQERLNASKVWVDNEYRPLTVKEAMDIFGRVDAPGEEVGR